MNSILKISLSILFITFSVYLSLAYGKIITIEEPNCTSSDFNLNSTLKNQILSKAIVEESLRIIPYKLDKDKIESLYSFFGEDPISYIVSYNDRYINYNNSTLLKLDVQPDITSIKNTLINIGLYFNTEKLSCRIKTQNFDEEDFINLNELIKLTGVSQDNNTASIEIDISKIRKSIYTGTLKYSDYLWSKSANSLRKLWGKLWGNYFNLPEIKSRYFSRVILDAGPWVTTSGLEDFFDLLNSKKELIDKTILISIRSSKGIYGKWEMISTRPHVLASFLDNYLGIRGMEFNIQILSPKKIP